MVQSILGKFGLRLSRIVSPNPLRDELRPFLTASSLFALSKQKTKGQHVPVLFSLRQFYSLGKSRIGLPASMVSLCLNGF